MEFLRDYNIIELLLNIIFNKPNNNSYHILTNYYVLGPILGLL